MKVMIRNWWTTIFGIVAAVLNQTTIGAKMPDSSEEWIKTLFSAVMIAWGVVQKDATTGSAPK